MEKDPVLEEAERWFKKLSDPKGATFRRVTARRPQGLKDLIAKPSPQGTLKFSGDIVV